MEDYLYRFEIKKIEKLSDGNLLVKWENPVGGFFFNSLDLWNYIYRNREFFKGKEKKISSFNEEGEILYSTFIDDNFLENHDIRRGLFRENKNQNSFLH